MTTSIITNLLEPMCELYYKYQKSIDIQSANINTVRNYGFSTSFTLNYGFELYEPFDINQIKLQPGVFTYNNVYSVLPNLSSSTTIDVDRVIKIQELPVSGIGTVNYINKTLPIKITVKQNLSSVVGIASAYETDGIPYDNIYNLNDSVIRTFESSLINDPDLAILILINLEDVTFVGNQYNWSALSSSLYKANVLSFRYDNGYGQFYSLTANSAFINADLYINTSTSSGLYNSTYMNVYNWANTLAWIPDFTSWYNLNSSTLPPFLHKFLIDYFGLT